NRNSIDTCRRIILYRVHETRNRISIHFVGRVSAKEVEQPAMISNRGIEPEIFNFLWQDHGHSIVNASQQFVRLGCYYRAGREPFTERRSPRLIQSGKTKRAFGFQIDEHRSFRTSGLLPLVKSIGNNQAASHPEGALESRLLGQCLSARVDEPAADLWIGRRG